MTDTRDPRLMRTIGLTLLAALLVVASCGVEPPPRITGAEQPSATAAAEQPPATAEVEQPSTTVEAENRTEILARLEVAIADDAAALREFVEEWQELRPEDRAAIQAGPVFTPMTVRPEIRNRQEVQAALIREYPGVLRDAGVSGRVVVWLYVSDRGMVLDRRVSRASDNVQFDEAALRVATAIRFTPAENRGDPVAVWIEIPITFEAR